MGWKEVTIEQFPPIQESSQKIEKSWQTVPASRGLALNHLAILEDGKRRAARNRLLPERLGYILACDTRLGIMRACRGWGIRFLTLGITYPQEYRSHWHANRGFHYQQLAEFLSDEDLKEEFFDTNTRVRHIGSTNNLPDKLVQALADLEKATLGNNGFRVNLVVNYDPRDETNRAARKMIDDEGSNFNVEGYLDTVGLPPFDLVVHTGRNMKNSIIFQNFVPQLNRFSSCRVISPVNFTDLTPANLLDIIHLNSKRYEIHRSGAKKSYGRTSHTGSR